MTKQFIICTFVGGIVAQIWGTISWMLIAYQSYDYRMFDNPAPVANAVAAQAQEPGIYMLPNYNDNHSDETVVQKWWEAASRGPFAFMVIQPKGINPSMAKPMFYGFLVNIFMAAVLFWLLNTANIEGFGRKALFVSIAGGIGAVYPHMANINWWHFPARFGLVCILDLFILWAFAGAAMVFVQQKLQAKA